MGVLDGLGVSGLGGLTIQSASARVKRETARPGSFLPRARMSAAQRVSATISVPSPLSTATELATTKMRLRRRME